MLLTFPEICQLLLITPFEAFVTFVSWIVFSILVCLKLEGVINATWEKMFIPLFVNLGVSLYLNVIVLIRRLKTGVSDPCLVSLKKHLASFICIVLVLLTEIFLIQKLDGHDQTTPYTQIFIPLYCYCIFLLIFYCIGCSRRWYSWHTCLPSNTHLLVIDAMKTWRLLQGREILVYYRHCNYHEIYR